MAELRLGRYEEAVSNMCVRLESDEYQKYLLSRAI